MMCGTADDKTRLMLSHTKLDRETNYQIQQRLKAGLCGGGADGKN